MRVDVAIGGAGPVGCALALALAAAGRRVRLVEARAAAPAPAFRPIALSHASRLILERLGAWDGLPVTPIDSVHVSQAGGPGRTIMEAAEAGVPSLGYVVDYGTLAGSLAALAAARVAEYRAGSALAPADHEEASCVVHAEGAAQGMREKRYAQDAIVAEVDVEPAAAGRAWERFTPEGPLALLPHAGRYGAVWAMRPARADALEQADDERFLGALQAAFGGRAGRFSGVRGRSRVALALRRRPSRVDGRQVYVGNAAQSLHPVAGQGLNLGLRDAWDLARCMALRADAGDPATLAHFAARRRLDAGATIGATDLLATLYVAQFPFAGAARAAAMLALDACGPARRFFARRMVFGPSAIP